MSNPRADWERIGNHYFRKSVLYNDVFDTDVDLESLISVGAAYGGAIDENKITAYKIGKSNTASIDIYSSSGKLIQRINWDKGSIKGLGWSDEEQLLVITEDGTVRCYYGLNGDFTQFSLGHGVEDFGVRECRFWSSGFVALLANNSLIEVSDYREPRPNLLAQPPNSTIHAWTITPPSQTMSRAVEVMISVERTIHVVDATQSEDRVLQNGPFIAMRVSPNGRFVVLSTEDNVVWVVSSDFQTKIVEYTPDMDSQPREIHWCGSDAVLLAWEDEIHAIEVDPTNSVAAFTRYFFDSPVHVIPELDGARLLTADSCEFLQRVSEVTESLFRLGSTAPAAVLLDAVHQLENKSPKADENIQLIRPYLAEAVDSCVKAASYEFNVRWQKELMKAASFGKSVLVLFDSDDFVDMCESLRVLNAVRDHRVGLSVTYEQFLRLTPERLVQRLIERNEHQLALKISEYLRLPSDKIYVHWACSKVRLSVDDDNLITRSIVGQLNGKRGISYEKIARTAYDEGRANLATQLLNYEPRAEKQVPLLLSMEEDEVALDKAIESGDTDLIHFVLLQLKQKLPLARFFQILNSRPTASAIVETSAKENDHALIKDMYYQDDRRMDSANLALIESISSSLDTVSGRVDKIKLASKLVEGSKDAATYMKSLDEYQRLLKLQESLEKELTASDGESYIGLSVNATLFKLVRLGYSSRAKKLAGEFKLSDRTIWWIRLRGLVQKRDWSELEEVAKVKKSPIGWEPFFNLTLSAGNSKLASLFVPKCTNLTPQERAEMWVKCGQLVKAAEELIKAKDLAGVDKVKGAASGQTALEIEHLLAAVKK